MSAEKRKFTLHLGTTTATRESLLTKMFQDRIERGEVQKLTARHKADDDLDAYFVLSHAKTPRWMESLSETFEVPAFKRKSPASVVVFKVAGRIFAATFGFGSKLLNEYEVEADFG